MDYGGWRNMSGVLVLKSRTSCGKVFSRWRRRKAGTQFWTGKRTPVLIGERNTNSRMSSGWKNGSGHDYSYT